MWKLIPVLLWIGFAHADESLSWKQINQEMNEYEYEEAVLYNYKVLKKKVKHGMVTLAKDLDLSPQAVGAIGVAGNIIVYDRLRLYRYQDITVNLDNPTQNEEAIFSINYSVDM